MNRIVVIGNGFDKAHGLATGYKDFIDNYWTHFGNSIYPEYDVWQMNTYGVIKDPNPYEDEFLSLKVLWGNLDNAVIPPISQSCESPYGQVIAFLTRLSRNGYCRCSVKLIFKNRFFGHISACCSVSNWLDIENEYYGQLKRLLTEEDAVKRSEKVRELNADFNAIKKRLENYLVQIVDSATLKPIPSIRKAVDSVINPIEIAHGKQDLFFRSIMADMVVAQEDVSMIGEIEEEQAYQHFASRDEQNRHYLQKKLKIDSFRKRYCMPHETLFLNFNYTSTAERLYVKEDDEVVNIHGQLGNTQNPIIFGYGDEQDEDYQRIERLQDNDFLDNIKSVHYHETGNYRKLLGFMELEPYQVFIMGHSCGNSDRTLLKTLFEHNNCMSVKVYYHQREDGTDDYSQLIRNLSRNFSDKADMRDKVVNKENCLPLVPMENLAQPSR